MASAAAKEAARQVLDEGKGNADAMSDNGVDYQQLQEALRELRRKRSQ